MTALVDRTPTFTSTTPTPPGDQHLTYLLEHHLQAIHDAIWHAVKAKIYAVRGVLDSAKGPRDHENRLIVPPALQWACVAGYHWSRFSVADGRWFVTRRAEGGCPPRTYEISPEFVNASVPECRKHARVLLNAALAGTCSCVHPAHPRTAALKKVENR